MICLVKFYYVSDMFYTTCDRFCIIYFSYLSAYIVDFLVCVLFSTKIIYSFFEDLLEVGRINIVVNFSWISFLLEKCVIKRFNVRDCLSLDLYVLWLKSCNFSLRVCLRNQLDLVG